MLGALWELWSSSWSSYCRRHRHMRNILLSIHAHKSVVRIPGGIGVFSHASRRNPRWDFWCLFGPGHSKNQNKCDDDDVDDDDD
eukprot:2559859-Karenia_brevis.AAC.1